MFKWFAPLLLFAGKPEVLLRLAVVAIAGAVVFFGVWLISNIAVTFDTLKSPAIAAIYAAVMLLFFLIVSAVAWLRLRRMAPPAKKLMPRSAPEVPLPDDTVARRTKELAGQWQAESRRAARRPEPRAATGPVAMPVAPAGPAPAQQTAHPMLIVTGPADTGKSALIARLVEASAAKSVENQATVRLADAGPSDGDETQLAALLAAASQSAGVLFVVDQDLRAPEVAAITQLRASRKPVYVVLNKADQFAGGDRDAILLSIRGKMPKGFAPGHVVAAAGAPLPVEREIEDARGAVRVELRRPLSDVGALMTLLARALASPGQSLRFEST